MVSEIRTLPGVRVVKCEHCRFGPHSWDHSGETVDDERVVGFLTNCSEIAAEVDPPTEGPNAKRDGKQVDQPSNRGSAKWRAQYPPKLVAAILQGLQQALMGRGVLDALSCGPTVEEPCHAAACDYDKVYYDEITGAELLAHLVREAMEEEIRYMRQLGVYEEVTKDWCVSEGLTPVGARWVLVNKGDIKNPVIRARLVAQETKRVSALDPSNPSATFAATPPVEALRFMLSLPMTGPRKPQQYERVLGFFDISRAHFHSPARRKIAIRVPKEDTECSSRLAKLLVAMYGTKDAAQCFDNLCEDVMVKMGYVVGILNLCLYHHPVKDISVYRFVDDFVVCGTRAQVAEFKDELGKHLIVKHLGTLGPCKALGDCQEVRCLNRLIRWVCPPFGKGVERIEYEADPRHAELVIAFCGLKPGSKGVTTPGEK